MSTENKTLTFSTLPLNALCSFLEMKLASDKKGDFEVWCENSRKDEILKGNLSFCISPLSGLPGLFIENCDGFLNILPTALTEDEFEDYISSNENKELELYVFDLIKNSPFNSEFPQD